ncbi:MAG: hypothetical protein ACXVZ1_09435, partial [Gaiellaceae bacterium]
WRLARDADAGTAAHAGRVAPGFATEAGTTASALICAAVAAAAMAALWALARRAPVTPRDVAGGGAGT